MDDWIEIYIMTSMICENLADRLNEQDYWDSFKKYLHEEIFFGNYRDNYNLELNSYKWDIRHDEELDYKKLPPSIGRTARFHGYLQHAQAGGGPLNYAAEITTTIRALGLPALIALISSYLTLKHQKKVKIKFGEIEIEANNEKELRKLLKDVEWLSKLSEKDVE